MAVAKHFTKILAIAMTVLIATETAAQTTEQPVLPWENDFISKWGLNDDIAWMAEDISEFDLNYNDGLRAGIWGLTASSARFFGLKVNNAIDERFNVRKSTEAVVKYMHNLISFNHGDTLAAITMYINTPLVEETDSIFKRPSCVVKHIDLGLLEKLDSAYNARQKTIVIRKPVSVCTIQDPKKADVSLQPAVIDSVKQVMAVDGTTGEMVKPAIVVVEEKEIIHLVKSGDTLSHLAKKYNVSISDIQKWNKLKGDLIKIGQKLIIRTKE